MEENIKKESTDIHPEAVRVFELLETLTSNGRWIFSQDLGGAQDSGFAWAFLDMEFDENGEPVYDKTMAEGKDLASLLDYIGFTQGLTGKTRWKKAFSSEDIDCIVSLEANDLNLYSDEEIEHMFVGTNFGEAINNSSTLRKREFLATALQNQVDGFWCGSALYRILENNGFLIDAKSGPKKLTTLGKVFVDKFGK